MQRLNAGGLLVPGQEHFDNMRRLLTKLEFVFLDKKEAPDHMEISTLLVGIENSRAYLEASIYDELSLSAGEAFDISQL